VPRNNLAMLLMDAGTLDAAEREFSALFADARESMGETHLMTAIFLSNRGHCRARMSHFAGAHAELKTAHAH